MAQFFRITTQPIPDLREHGIPADFAAFIEQAMARDPDQRPSALGLGQQLQQLQARHGLAVDEMAILEPERVDTSHSVVPRSRAAPSGRGLAAGDTLPALASGVVGRAVELARLRELLSCSRLATLTGIGGVGKTTLAIHAAHQLSVDHPDGVWLVELADLRDGSLLAGLVATTLGIRSQSTQPPIELLVDALGQRRTLIVLDNCEHIIDDAAKLIDTLLRHCPAVHIVATSREVLAVGGEAVLALSPLACPSPTDDPSLGGLAAYGAVALFMQCARAAVPEFELTEHNAAAVTGICARLDGLPLAIELAAARLRAMSVEQVSEGLCDSFALLSRGHCNAPTRQQSLACCIDWSYELCTKNEQQVWARLSVFAGSFELRPGAWCMGG